MCEVQLSNPLYDTRANNSNACPPQSLTCNDAQNPMKTSAMYAAILQMIHNAELTIMCAFTPDGGGWIHVHFVILLLFIFFFLVCLQSGNSAFTWAVRKQHCDILNLLFLTLTIMRGVCKQTFLERCVQQHVFQQARTYVQGETRPIQTKDYVQFFT